MHDYYLILVIILGILAIADLMVGVSNDAVNFLNSAIGSKVVSFKTLMIIASLGVAFGAMSSSGMMEVARKGIFNPEMFIFSEIMIIFLAVMITDILLLDVFNSYGLPTSTTVSIVFELLGAAVIVSLIKISNIDDSVVDLANYINTTKATQIILGIFLSVVVAFSIGALVQFISRLVLSFRFQNKSKWLGSFFGGIAITSIFYFIIIKGLKGSPYASTEFELLGNETLSNFLDNNLVLIIIVSSIFWIIISHLINTILKFSIYTIVICAGTFALALAFAGNDLVNFIGVPIAGYQSFLAWVDSGLSADNYTMEILSEKVAAPTEILLGAGAIMIITLWTSSKAKSVIKTSIDLSNQEETIERFQPNFLSRFLVKAASNIQDKITAVIPENSQKFIANQYIKPKPNNLILKKDRPAFDEIRASVNLVVAAILISIATSYKLPLSTTYVTFMVAMGTSLADKAWGSDSAVYRVAGVINVIGGWLLTALIAFTASGIIATILYYLGKSGLFILVVVVVFVLTKNYFAHKNRRKIEIEEEKLDIVESKSIKGVIFESSKNISNFSRRANKLILKILEGIGSKDLNVLKENKDLVKKLKNDLERVGDDVFYFVKNLDETSTEITSKFHMNVLEELENITDSISSLSSLTHKHINNNHRGLTFNQIRELKELEDELDEFFTRIVKTFKTKNYTEISEIFEVKEKLVSSLELKIKSQISRTRKDESSPRNTRLYFEILNKMKTIITHYVQILELYSNKYDDKIDPIL
jgi:phosphate/sulfate permease